MRIIGRSKLSEFAGTHADARPWIGNWIAETELAQWRTPQELKNLYASASFLADNIVIFNVKGNRYRLEALVAYNTSTVVVRWIGTHAEYTKRID
jgi:mRNA interferase HigB